LAVPNQVDLAGEIQEQPFGSEIRAGVRCKGETRWGLIGGIGNTARSKEWRIPGALLVEPPVRKNRVCQVAAFVAPPLNSKTSMDDRELHQVAYRVSDPILVEVDAGQSGQTERAFVEVLSIAGQPADPTQTATVPPSFDVRGGSRNLGGRARVWLAGECGGQAAWTILASGAVGPSGEWTTSDVRVPESSPGSACQLVALVGGSTRPETGLSLADMEARSEAHSAVHRFVGRPLYLEIEAIAEGDGRVHKIDEELRTGGTVKLRTDPASLTIVGDALRADLKVSVVASPDQRRWYGFDPAALESPGEWRATIGLIMPGAASSLLTLMVVVSRASLYGRAITSEELNTETLGHSVPVRVSAPTLPCQVKDLALLSVDGRNPLESWRLPATGDRVWVTGRERFECAGFAGMVGVIGPDGGTRFEPTHPDRNGAWSQRVPLPKPEDYEGRSDADVVYVVAPRWWDQRRVDAAWWGAFAAGGTGARAPIRLPPASWAFRWWTVANGTFQKGRRFVMPVSVIQFFMGVIVACALALSWRTVRRMIQLTLARVHGGSDGRLPSASRLPEIYQRRTKARRDAEKAGLEQRHGPGIAGLMRKATEWKRIAEGAKERLHALPAEAKASWRQRFSPAFHHAALVVTCAGDLVLTIVVFRTLALEADVAVWALSLAFGVGATVLSVFVGGALRRSGSRTAVALIVVAVIVLGGAIWVANEFRVTRMDNVMIASHPTLRWGFMPVNAVLVLAAVILAYMRDREAEEEQKERQSQERACKTLSKVEGRIEKRRKRLDARLSNVDAFWADCEAAYARAFERSQCRNRGGQWPAAREEYGETVETPGDLGENDRTIEVAAGFANTGNGHNGHTKGVRR
jgi:hypothetical protein